MSEQVTNGTAISMAQAQEIAAQYRNVTIEDVQLGGAFPYRYPQYRLAMQSDDLASLEFRY
ncbi:hypothetical protein OLZ31_24560 [Enterobacter asburiae]|nr:hypothetical protein [Enterobacter asburiae]